MRSENERFWIMDLAEEPNISDLKKSIANNEIIGLVDEEAGGIIAYILISNNQRQDNKRLKEILDLLNDTRQSKIDYKLYCKAKKEIGEGALDYNQWLEFNRFGNSVK